MQRTLIVTGDDFGMTAGVNAGILHAFREGILTSASIMACGGAFEEAMAASRATPELGVCVHLCLTEGRPISPPALVPSPTELEFDRATARGIPRLIFVKGAACAFSRVSGT